MSRGNSSAPMRSIPDLTMRSDPAMSGINPRYSICHSLSRAVLSLCRRAVFPDQKLHFQHSPQEESFPLHAFFHHSTSRFLFICALRRRIPRRGLGRPQRGNIHSAVRIFLNAAALYTAEAAYHWNWNPPFRKKSSMLPQGMRPEPLSEEPSSSLLSGCSAAPEDLPSTLPCAASVI